MLAARTASQLIRSIDNDPHNPILIKTNPNSAAPLIQRQAHRQPTKVSLNFPAVVSTPLSAKPKGTLLPLISSIQASAWLWDVD
jgi:hypothetical protein